MRRIPLALALVGAFAVTGCMSGSKAPAGTDSGAQQGVAGVSYIITVPSPAGGYVSSSPVGITCGQGIDVVCSGTFAWTQQVILTAHPTSPNALLAWAGDCSGSGLDCTINAPSSSASANGADKTVVAVFGPAGGGHGNFSDGAVHGAVFNAGTLDCAKCHFTGAGSPPDTRLAPACSTCHTPPPNPGLKVAVTSVTSTNSNIVVTFTVKDGADKAIDIAQPGAIVAPRVALGSFATVGGQVQPYAIRTGTATSPNTVTAPACNVAYTAAAGGIACTPSTGTYVFTLPTSVTLDATKSADPHTVWVQATRQTDAVTNSARTFNAVNAVYNFTPGAINVAGTPSAAKREIVDTDKCNNCHNGFKPETASNVGGFHGYGRVEGPFCNVCHNIKRSNAVSGGADSAIFIHRIHGAEQTGQPTTLDFHGIRVTYPQPITNCDACHSGAAQGTQWQTNPTDYACSSCHWGVKFVQATPALPVCNTLASGAFTANCFHSGGAPVVSCQTCHGAAAIALYHVSVLPPDAGSTRSLATITTGTMTTGSQPMNSTQVGKSCADPASKTPADPTLACTCTTAAPCAPSTGNTNTNAAYIAAAKAVPTSAAVITWEMPAIDPIKINATGKIEVKFKFKNGAADVVFDAASRNVAGGELMPNFVGGPSVYAVYALNQDGIASPVDFNSSSSAYVRNVWNGTATAPTGGTVPTISGPDGSGFYTMTLGATLPIDGSVKMLTGGVGYTYSLTSTHPLTQTNLPAYPFDSTTWVGGLVVPAPNVYKAADSNSQRRSIVSTAKCEACHAQLGVEPTFHAGQRNDGPTCSFCHNPNRTSNAWSANASTFIHGIHGASKRAVGFSWHSGGCPTTAPWSATAMACVDPTLPTLPAGANFVTPNAPWYPEVEYPNQLKNCEACHVAGAYDFSLNATSVPYLLWTTVGAGKYTNDTPSNSPYIPAFGVDYGKVYASSATGVVTQAAATTLVNSPITAACFSCHDSTGAKAHMEGMGGWIYKARGAGFNATAPANVETCLDCHGPGKVFSIADMHK